MVQLKLSLQEKLSTLRQLDSEVLDLIEDEHLENEIQHADEYKDGAIARIDHYTQTHKVPTRPASTPPPDAIHVTTSTVAEHRVKLPKLSIRPFEGDITHSAIHTISSLITAEGYCT